MSSRVSSARMLQLLRPIAEGVVRAAAHLLWWKIRGLFAQKGKKKKEIGPESETCLREVSSARKQDTELPFCSLISLSKLL